MVALVALLLGAYCLLSAAVALSDTSPDNPNPAELAARERYQWPGIIPVLFLTLVVIYVVVIATRRRQKRSLSDPPSTQIRPPTPPVTDRLDLAGHPRSRSVGSREGRTSPQEHQGDDQDQHHQGE